MKENPSHLSAKKENPTAEKMNQSAMKKNKIVDDDIP